jgi:hypothetical protein
MKVVVSAKVFEDFAEATPTKPIWLGESGSPGS